MRAALLLILLPLSLALADPGALDRARRAADAAYQQRDLQAFELALDALARLDTAEAVDALLAVLERATLLDAYQPAVRSLARMKTQPARARLLALARGAADWEHRAAALEAVSYWDEGEPLVLAALDAPHPMLRQHARRIVAEMGSAAGVGKLISQLDALSKAPRASARDQRMRAVLAGLLAATGKRLTSVEAYRRWWESMSFIDQDRYLAAGRRPPLEREVEAPKQGSFSPLMENWRRRRPSDWKLLTELKKRDVIVVTGFYDKVQKVLTHLGIPYTLISRANFPRLILSPKQVLIFNCTHTGHAAQMMFRMLGKEVRPEDIPLPTLPGGGAPRSTLFRHLTDGEIGKVRAFVKSGGYLFTSDWELGNVLVRAFPEHVGIGGQTESHHVDIAPLPERRLHPLLKDVFSANPYLERRYRWHIDPRSFLIKIKHPEVVPLVVAPAMGKTYKNDLVAVSFRPGPVTGAKRPAGRVLHVLGHFHKQRQSETDHYALQQMLLNLIALKRRELGKR